MSNIPPNIDNLFLNVGDWNETGDIVKAKHQYREQIKIISETQLILVT